MSRLNHWSNQHAPDDLMEFIKSRAGRKSIKNRALASGIEADIAALIGRDVNAIEIQVDYGWGHLEGSCQLSSDAEIEIWASAEDVSLLADQLDQINTIIRERNLYLLFVEAEVGRILQDEQDTDLDDAVESALYEFNMDEMGGNFSISLEVLV